MLTIWHFSTTLLRPLGGTGGKKSKSLQCAPQTAIDFRKICSREFEEGEIYDSLLFVSDTPLEFDIERSAFPDVKEQEGRFEKLATRLSEEDMECSECLSDCCSFEQRTRERF